MAKLARDADNMVVYLKSHRLHKVKQRMPCSLPLLDRATDSIDSSCMQALVERYNPTNTLSGEERARMSAKMVGLSMPKPFGDELDDNGVLTLKKGTSQSVG